MNRKLSFEALESRLPLSVSAIAELPAAAIAEEAIFPDFCAVEQAGIGRIDPGAITPNDPPPPSSTMPFRVDIGVGCSNQSYDGSGTLQYQYTTTAHLELRGVLIGYGWGNAAVFSTLGGTDVRAAEASVALDGRGTLIARGSISVTTTAYSSDADAPSTKSEHSELQFNIILVGAFKLSLKAHTAGDNASEMQLADSNISVLATERLSVRAEAEALTQQETGSGGMESSAATTRTVLSGSGQASAVTQATRGKTSQDAILATSRTTVEAGDSVRAVLWFELMVDLRSSHDVHAGRYNFADTTFGAFLSVSFLEPRIEDLVFGDDLVWLP